MKRLACVVAPRTALVLSLFTLVLAQACGSTGRPSAGSSPAAPSGSSPAPAGSPARQTAAALSDADSGRTVRMRRGEVVSVALHEANGFKPWSRLATSDGAVLTPIVDTRAAAVRGVTLASFRGAAPGTAQLTSSASQDCSAGTQCTALARGWTVTVIVS